MVNFYIKVKHEKEFMDKIIKSINNKGKMNLNLNNLKSLTTEEIMASSFGIEWEGLRTTSNGHLSLTPHPKRFEIN